MSFFRNIADSIKPTFVKRREEAEELLHIHSALKPLTDDEKTWIGHTTSSGVNTYLLYVDAPLYSNDFGKGRSMINSYELERKLVRDHVEYRRKRIMEAQVEKSVLMAILGNPEFVQPRKLFKFSESTSYADFESEYGFFVARYGSSNHSHGRRSKFIHYVQHRVLDDIHKYLDNKISDDVMNSLELQYYCEHIMREALIYSMETRGREDIEDGLFAVCFGYSLINFEGSALYRIATEDQAHGQGQRSRKKQDGPNSNQRHDQTKTGKPQSRYQEALAILELEDGAGYWVLKQRYQLMCSRLHPDKGGSNYMQERVNWAYHFLLDDEKWTRANAPSRDRNERTTASSAPQGVSSYPSGINDLREKWVLPVGYTATQLDSAHMKYLGKVLDKQVDRINAEYEQLEPFAVV